MSKRLEEITNMVNALDEDSFAAFLYGYEMDSDMLISDFVYLLEYIKDKQAELDTLSMAHDAIHRELPKDKHMLIKNIIGLNKRVQELEEECAGWKEASRFNDEELYQQNKRYRDLLEKVDYLLEKAGETDEDIYDLVRHVRTLIYLEGEE